jgi:AraC-like DNA-binding protein
VDYVERVNRAIDHVVGNLAHSLTLEEVSKAAGFSPFHFHRVFKAFLGETLSQFVKRQRLERALFLMSHAPQQSLTNVAMECGFSSSSDFSRSFKQHYGLPPSTFDIEAFRSRRREELERVLSSQLGSSRVTTLPAGQNPDGFEATLRDLPARKVAYIRVLEPFREGVAQAACERLPTETSISKSPANCRSSPQACDNFCGRLVHIGGAMTKFGMCNGNFVRKRHDVLRQRCDACQGRQFARARGPNWAVVCSQFSGRAQRDTARWPNHPIAEPRFDARTAHSRGAERAACKPLFVRSHRGWHGTRSRGAGRR